MLHTFQIRCAINGLMVKLGYHIWNGDLDKLPGCIDGKSNELNLQQEGAGVFLAHGWGRFCKRPRVGLSVLVGLSMLVGLSVWVWV